MPGRLWILPVLRYSRLFRNNLVFDWNLQKGPSKLSSSTASKSLRRTDREKAHVIDHHCDRDDCSSAAARSNSSNHLHCSPGTTRVEARLLKGSSGSSHHR